MENQSKFEEKFTLNSVLTMEDTIAQLGVALGFNDDKVKANCPQLCHSSYKDCTVTISKHPRWNNAVLLEFWEKDGSKIKHTVSVTSTGEFWD